MLEVLGLSSKAKPKAPSELVRAACEAVLQLEAMMPQPSSSNQHAALVEEITRHFSVMKQTLYGEPDNPPDKQIALELAREVRAALHAH